MPDLPAGLNKDEMRERIRRERVELVLESIDSGMSGDGRSFANRQARYRYGNQADCRKNTIYQTRGSKMTKRDGKLKRAVVQTNESHTGNASVEIPDGGHVYRTLPVTPDTKYVLSAWVKTTAQWGLLGVRDFGSTGEVNVQHNAGEGWVQKTVSFTTGPTSTEATIFSWWPAGSAGFIDDFELSEPTSIGLSYNRFVINEGMHGRTNSLFSDTLIEVSIIPDFSANQNPGW